MDEEDFFANYPPAAGTESSTPPKDDSKDTPTLSADTDKKDSTGDEDGLQQASKEAIFAPPPPPSAADQGTGEDNSNVLINDSAPAPRAPSGGVMQAEKSMVDDVEEEDGVNKMNGTANGEKDEGEEQEEEEEEENEKVKAWRKEFAKRLEEKVAREKEVKAERMEEANQVLNSMNEKWKAKCAKNKEANLEAEKEFLARRDGLIGRMSKKGENPNWAIVEHFADLTGKYKQGQRDTSRMRQVILRMKAAQQKS